MYRSLSILLAWGCMVCWAPAAFHPVITEFMASNRATLTDEDGDTPDWIEVHNAGDSSGNLAGWYLTDATNDLTRWTFPDTPLAAGAYQLVYASGKNRVVSGAPLHTSFELSAGGEYLALVASNGVTIATAFGPDFGPQLQDVSYGSGLGTTNLVTVDTRLRYRIPADASEGVAWTATAYDDSAWEGAGVPLYPGIGYENSPGGQPNYVDLLSTTVPSGTRGFYSRFAFTVDDPTAISGLSLQVQYDDGFVAYLNGIRVASNFAPDPLAWNSTATDGRSDSLCRELDGFDLAAYSGLLVPGNNVLALHALNSSSSSSDLLLSPRLGALTGGGYDETLAGYLDVPTPGQPNAALLINAGPWIRAVTDSPLPPADGDALTISAVVEAKAAAVAEVRLEYRVNYGSPVNLTMRDDGLGGDAVAGDGEYTATIPAAAAGPGAMLRWAVSTTDVQGRSSREPVLMAALGSNVAPEYFGTRIQDPATDAGIPTFAWWTQNESASRSVDGTRGSLFYDGRLFDNIFVRKRGGYTNTHSQKFDFNKGHDFYLNDEVGYVTEINLNAQGADASYLRQPLVFAFHREVGNPACFVHFVQMRLNGSFDRVGILIEQVDDRFLDRYDYNPDGELYKFVQRSNLMPALNDLDTGIEKKTGDKTDLSSAQTLVDALKGTPDARRRFLMDYLDLPEFINYWACRVLTVHADDVRKNFYLYQDLPGDGQWREYPWDMDYSFGIVGGHNNQDSMRVQHPLWGIEEYPTADGNNQWNKLYDAVFENRELRDMALRRVRTLMDSHLHAPGGGASTSWFNAWIDAQWPTLAGLSGPSSGARDSLVAEFEKRRNELFSTYTSAIPGFPGERVPGSQAGALMLHIADLEFNPVSGIQDEEYVELVNTNTVAVDLSGWTVEGAIRFTFAPGTVVPPASPLYLVRDVAAFRARTSGPRGGQGLFMVGGYQGGLNNFGETLELRDPAGRLVDRLVYEGNPTDLQRYLRMSELHFHPHPAETNRSEAAVSADEFEFVELYNAGPDSLDLSGAGFTDGIRYTFPSNTVLAVGARLVVAGNPGAFATRYGPLPVLGPFLGNLGNGSEHVELRDAPGNKVHAFTYRDEWGRYVDGIGHSLVPVDLEGDYGAGSNWRDSAGFHGSPGAADPQPLRDVVVNEVLSHTDLPLSDSIELVNLSGAPVDISGWLLSDQAAEFRKFLFPPGSILPPGGYLVVDETDFNPTPLSPGPRHFALSAAHGDEVWLVAAGSDGTLLRVADGDSFGAAVNGEAFGRWLNGDGKLVPMVTRTLTAGNSAPRVGPVVISEIMYHPVGDTNGVSEFVEIYNPGDTLEPLDRWVLTGAVHYAFSSADVLPAGETRVLVHFDPVNDVTAATAFRARYGLSTAVPLFGPYDGRLDNAGETLDLFRPDTPPLEEPYFYPLLVEDTAVYEPIAPWPVSADGGGDSLHRLAPGMWGPDPFSWTAAFPSPGVYAETILTGYALWSVSVFPPGTSAAVREASADPNANRRPNLAEYAFGSDPLADGIPISAFHLRTRADGALVVSFRRRIIADDVEVRVALSDDFSSWDSSHTHVQPAGSAVPDADGLTEWVPYLVDAEAFSPGIGFIRLQVLSLP